MKLISSNNVPTNPLTIKLGWVSSNGKGDWFPLSSIDNLQFEYSNFSDGTMELYVGFRNKFGNYVVLFSVVVPSSDEIAMDTLRNNVLRQLDSLSNR